MQTKTWSRSPLLVTSTIIFLSLIATFVLFFYLESYAEVKDKKVQLGGAAACFVITFILARNTYTKISGSDEQREKEALERKVDALQQQLDKTKVKFTDLTVPEEYLSEVSEDFGIAFCYPKSWSFVRHPFNIQYGTVSDPQFSKEHGYNRNFVISLDFVNPLNFDFKSNVEQNVDMIIKIFLDGELISLEPFLLHGNSAYRFVINGIVDKKDITLYQVQVLSQSKDRLVGISFSTIADNFESAKGLFEDVLGTIRFSE